MYYVRLYLIIKILFIIAFKILKKSINHKAIIVHFMILIQLNVM